MWERELELIESLGKLYPEFDDAYGLIVKYRIFKKTNHFKAAWVWWLCADYLECRMPSLERFIKENDLKAWNWYKKDFNITDEQCGKEN